MSMEKETLLDHDMTLDWRSISARQGHFGASTDYIASKRQVEHRTWGAKRRFFGLLPPKSIGTGPEYLDVPEDITTEAALIRFVKRERPGWIVGHRR